MIALSFSQRTARVEYWLRKLPFTLGALCDWLLQRTLGVGLPLDWSEFELSEVIRKHTVFYRGRRMAPHRFQISIGWQQHQNSPTRTLADWETWLAAAAGNEISRQELLVFAPIEARACVNVLADRLTVEASFGEFEKLLQSERRRSRFEPGTADRPYSLPGRYRIIIQSASGQQQRLLALKPGQDRLYLGSSRDCDVVIPGDRVSAIHAVLFFNTQGQLLLADLGSRTGTFVAERKLQEGEAVIAGDENRLLIGGVPVLLRKE